MRKRFLPALVCATLLGTSSLPPAAVAVPIPDMSIAPAAVPTGDVPRPVVEMAQSAQCATGGTLEGTDYKKAIPVSNAFRVDELHKYATGKGVTVAVIDSGVSPNPRLPRLEGGGDYVMGQDGLEDCDKHGTLIAGIIGAQASDQDSFVGVAPDVSLISIRQTSAAYTPVNDADKQRATSTLATLAGAIVRATNLGADVINMSVTSCFSVDQPVDTSDLKAAIKYAYDRNVVLVTAAGNADAQGCTPNPSYDPNTPRDYRNWTGAEHISMPSYYTPALLSVGGSTLQGQPHMNTMAGPWVDVAAPAEGITSLDPHSDGGLINASRGSQDELAPITGTSFSAAYISGLAALILELHPNYTADQVMATITNATQEGTSDTVNIVGEGVVDPVAALTRVSAAHTTRLQGSLAIEQEYVALTPHAQAERVAWGVLAACALTLVLVLTAKLVRSIGKKKQRSAWLDNEGDVA